MSDNWLARAGIEHRVAAMYEEALRRIGDAEQLSADVMIAREALARAMEVGQRAEGDFGLRPEVLAFARAMERNLRANDHKGGWGQMDPQWLLKRLRQEAGELERVMVSLEIRREERPGDPLHWRPNMERITDEAADVANFAMMIADVCGSTAT